MEIASITDSTTAKGLKLAGVKKAYEAESKEEGIEKLDQVLDKEEIGIIIITEDLAQKMDERLSRFREEKEKVTPILIEIPTKEGPVPERREVIDKIVKRAVGIKIEE